MEENKPKQKTFKNRNIFAYLDNILATKNRELMLKHLSEDGFETDFKKVVLLRYLSMSRDPSVRKAVLENQLSLERMDCKTAYRFLFKVIPRQNSGFIKYLR
jgi:hypothetical protein